MESLNDTVFDITGVRVRETLPDSVIDNANEVELVDLTPDALINRLRRGDIYKVEKVPQALSNFFRKGNIVALRELALRKTAEEVDGQFREYEEDDTAVSRLVAQDNILVCITPRPAALKLIRRGYRVASRLQADFTCLYVAVPERRPASTKMRPFEKQKNSAEISAGVSSAYRAIHRRRRSSTTPTTAPRRSSLWDNRLRPGCRRFCGDRSSTG